MNIIALTWPIFVEVLLRTALNASDVFMLSGYSDLAVSAVGVISQISFFLIVISMMVSSGAGILIAQYNGAGNALRAAHTAVASLLLGLGIGSFLSLSSFFGAHQFVLLYRLEDQVAQFAYEYLIISGSMTINITIGIVISTILRSHGYSKSPMVINLIAGVFNLVGNYIALYQPFGLPVYGVQGVAISTVTSQIIATLLLWLTVKYKKIDIPFLQMKEVPKTIYKKILRIGVMNAGENLSYNMAQMVIVYFVVQMGTSSLTAFVYAQNIARFSFAFALSIGQASQIQTGYFIGKGWSEQILIKIQHYFIVAFFGSIFIASSIYFFKAPIINLFTQDTEITRLVAQLIAGSILIEAGRVFNLIFISALKGAGDVRFPVIIGILSMWGLGVAFSYILGFYFGLGVLGAWFAIALDELCRGVIMLKRWRSKKWTRFSLTHDE